MRDSKGWQKSLKFRTKYGDTIALHDMTAEDIDKLDEKKGPLLFDQPIASEIVLLALSADAYPVAIEKRARQLRKMLGQG